MFTRVSLWGLYFCRLIAREMVKMHSIDPVKCVSEEDRPLISIDTEPCIFKFLLSFMNKIPEEYPNEKQNSR